MFSKHALVSNLAIFADTLVLGGQDSRSAQLRNAVKKLNSHPGLFTEAIQALKSDKTLLPLLKEYEESGTFKEMSELKEGLPRGLLQISTIPVIGAEMAKAIFQKMDITSIDELRFAAREKRLSKSGLLDSATENQLSRFKYYLVSDLAREAQLLITYLQIRSSGKIAVVGDIRRKMETSHEIRILTTDPLVPTLLDGYVEKSIPVVVKVTNAEEFAKALIVETGSLQHVNMLKQKAGGEIPNADSEEEIYHKLGLPYIEPELRENEGELSGIFNSSALLISSDIKGIFHCHTTFSDGVNSLEEMVVAAEKLGFEYIGITEHSASATHTRGITKKQVLEQFKKIDELQKKHFIKIFKGIESDILEDGNLDYSEDILKKFDFVIGSVHNDYGQTGEEITRRVMKAMDNPHLDILGHPTNRMLTRVAGYDIQMHRIIRKAAETGVIIELNANPYRLDVSWCYGSLLKSLGVKVSINPDAHSVAGLQDVELGVGTARKAGLTKTDVLNTLTREEVLGKLRSSNGKIRKG